MIPVIVYDKGQCDPRKCTAKRMEKFGLARELPLRRIPPGCVVLSPFGEEVLSPADLPHARRGLVVMDLTWTNIADFPHVRGERARRLPYLVASNPVNFGRPWRLNSAEAVLASLVIMGQDEQADLFVPRFNWAPTFLAMNRELLDAYRAAGDAAGVQRVSDEYVGSVTAGNGGGEPPKERRSRHLAHLQWKRRPPLLCAHLLLGIRRIGERHAGRPSADDMGSDR